MIDELNSIGSKALSEVEASDSVSKLETIRVSFLGKKGALSQVLRGLSSLGASDRPRVGSIANEWKKKIERAIRKRREVLEDLALEKKLSEERIDVSIPPRKTHRGTLHPITQATVRIVEVFSRIGFDVTTGPEAETEFLTFDAVNIPKDHPARDMQDTFFLGPGVVLRTHTSPVQMRTMRERDWPVRILCPGAVYRCDNDATHSPMFHQIEGLWVDKGVRMSDLVGTLEFFVREIFGQSQKIRLRPSYFPFVEPGVEVDMTCLYCASKGCRICKKTGWLEILGAGMVHPKLFEMAGYDPSEVTGFAFGLGVDRVAMLLHRFPHIRMLFQNDVRFLNQF